MGSDYEIRLFVLDLETTYVTHFLLQCPKVKLPRSRFEIHLLGLDSLKVILQTLSRLPFQSTNELSQVCLELEITLGHYSNLPFLFGAYQSLTYHSRSVPTIPIYHSQPPVSPKILNRHSRLHNYHSSSLHYK